MARHSSAQSIQGDDLEMEVDGGSPMLGSQRKKLRIIKSRNSRKSGASVLSREFVNDADEEDETPRSSKRKQDADEESGPTPKKKARRSRKSTQDDADEASKTAPPTPEDSEEVEDVNQKGRPRIPRKPRKSEVNDQTIGFFTSEEVQKMEAYKVKWCNLHNLHPSQFDEAVQYSARGALVPKWPGFETVENLGTKKDFWTEIYQVLHYRARRSVQRFARRHFTGSLQKAHEWSKEQDKELIQLQKTHGSRFSRIAKLIGRSEDDVVQRWKNRLLHRSTKKTGLWSKEEEYILLDLVEKVWKVNKEEGIDVGNDIYEMKLTDIKWGPMSDFMKHTRSRQQIADKWRKILMLVHARREDGDLSFKFDPTSTDRKVPRQRSSRTVSGSSSVEEESANEEFHDAVDSSESADIDIMQPPQSSPEPSPEPSAEVPSQTSSDASSDASSDESRQSSPRVSQASSLAPLIKEEFSEEPEVEAETADIIIEPFTLKTDHKRDQRSEGNEVPPSNPERESTIDEARLERRRLKTAERRESRRLQEEQEESEQQQGKSVNTDHALTSPANADKAAQKAAQKAAKAERKRWRAEQRELRRSRGSLNEAVES